MTSASLVPFHLAGKRIFVAGHNGMAGSAIVRRLGQEPCEVLVAERRDLDLTRQEATENYFRSTRPDVVVMAAGRVGGILANLSSGVSRRKSCHGAQLHPSEPHRWCTETAVSRIDVHLPEIRQTAHERGPAAHR